MEGWGLQGGFPLLPHCHYMKESERSGSENREIKAFPKRARTWSGEMFLLSAVLSLSDRS